MEWLLNPWVISIVLLAVVVGNLLALKNTANMTGPTRDKTTKEIDKLTKIEGQNRQKMASSQSQDDDASEPEPSTHQENEEK